MKKSHYLTSGSRVPRSPSHPLFPHVHRVPRGVGSVNAGCKAVPLLMNMKQVMQQRQVGGMWSSNDDLPVRERGAERPAGGDMQGLLDGIYLSY